MTKPLVLYHGSCPDGFCAAWVAHRALGDVELHPAKYGEAPPNVMGRTVYVLDFSFPRAVLEDWHRRHANLVVLDHHKSVIKDLAGLPYVTLDVERSGARLTWDHFFPEGNRALPALVAYVEDRDLWRWALPHTSAVMPGSAPGTSGWLSGIACTAISARAGRRPGCLG